MEHPLRDRPRPISRPMGRRVDADRLSRSVLSWPAGFRRLALQEVALLSRDGDLIDNAETWLATGMESGTPPSETSPSTRTVSAAEPAASVTPFCHACRSTARAPWHCPRRRHALFGPPAPTIPPRASIRRCAARHPRAALPAARAGARPDDRHGPLPMSGPASGGSSWRPRGGIR